MKKIVASIFLLTIFFSALPTSCPVFAQDGGSYNFNSQSGLDSTGVAAGYDTGSAAPTLESYISKIITIILSFLGVIFLALTIYAGIKWMTAAGNQDQVKKARELLIEAVIGLFIVLAAYAVTYFVLKVTSGTLVQ